MAKILKINAAMPCADLYLDDLEDLEMIIRDAIDKVGPPLSVTFEYEIAGEDSFRSIAELQEHGGTVKQLDVRVGINGARPERLLDLGRRWRPELSIPYELRSDGWAVNARVRELMSRRRDRMKEMMITMGDIAQTLIFSLALASCTAFLVLLTLKITSGKSYVVIGKWHFWLPIALLTAPWSVADLRSNRVYLRYSRADAAEASKRNRDLLRQIVSNAISGIIGAVLGGLLLIVLQRHYGLFVH